jgi:hypothetical protein
MTAAAFVSMILPLVSSWHCKVLRARLMAGSVKG